jgi:deoxyribonuclease-4
MNLIIGSHVGFTKDKQLLGSVMEALKYNANTFMFYTGAPQNTKRERLNNNLTIKAYDLMREKNIDIKNVIVHAPYIINLASPITSEHHDFAVSFLKQEIKRCEKLGVSKIVLHPGSHVGQGIEMGIQNIIESLNEAINEEQNVFVCLETMAGKGSECGSNFNELKSIIDGVKYNNKLMICLDTCHLNDAGYDISKFDDILDQFDKIIGLNKIGCIHINDSKNELGSKKDRHANVGLGTIGFDILLKVIYHPELASVPKLLETPYVKSDEDESYPPYKEEIRMIRAKKFDEKLLEHIVNQ